MSSSTFLITIDSVRSLRFLSPEACDSFSVVDRLVDAGGVSFSRAFATGPTTKSSFPGILTGTYGLTDTDYPKLSRERPFLASVLSDNGVETAGFTSNPFLSRAFNYDTGFDQFRDYQNPLERKVASLFPNGIERPGRVLERLNDILPVMSMLKTGYQALKGSARPYVSAERIVDDTISHLQGVESSFFCWTHFMDVHHPCYPPERYRDRHDVDATVDSQAVNDLYSVFSRQPETLTDAEVATLRRLYTAALDYVDDQIHRLLDEIDDTFDEATVIFTSDHGELFGDRGEYNKPARMYEELLEVPLVIRPASEDRSFDADALVSLIDVPPLVVDQFDADQPDAFEGKIPGEGAPRETLICEDARYGDLLVGVRSEEWWYEIDTIRDRHQFTRTVSGKPDGESQPADEEIATLLRDTAREHSQRLSISDDQIEVSKPVENRLAELGYLN